METNKFIVEFDYNKEQLLKIKEETSLIDKSNVLEIEEAVKKLVKVRRAIQTKGKDYRDEANAFNKMVISKEKEYVEIIEPVELELKDLLEAEKQRQVIEARKELLPMKLQQLSVLKVKMPTENEILSLDDTQWIEFYNQKFAEHNNIIAEEERKVKEEAERIEREAKIKADAEAKAEIEKAELLKKAEADKIKAVEQAQKDAELKALKEKQEAEDKIKKEQAEKEAKEKAEQEEQKKLEANKKYNTWLADNGWTEETKTDFVIEKVGNKVRLSKILSIYTLE